jgi:hypothetical protein
LDPTGRSLGRIGGHCVRRFHAFLEKPHAAALREGKAAGALVALVLVARHSSGSQAIKGDNKSEGEDRKDCPFASSRCHPSLSTLHLRANLLYKPHHLFAARAARRH